MISSMERFVLLLFLFFALCVEGGEYPVRFGTVGPYENSTSELRESLRKYGLTAHRFTDGISAFSIPFLMFVPSVRLKSVRERIPLVVYFAGSGERGQNLERLFAQMDAFEVVVNEEFQRRHPSCLLVPMLPDDVTFHTGLPGRANELVMCISNLIATVAGRSRVPRIDSSRIYLTGLSYGGSAAFELPCYLLNTFAASVLVSTFMNEAMLPNEGVLNYWLIHNRGIRENPRLAKALEGLARKVERMGGEFGYSEYPNGRHDAWHRAWREPSVWDWVFSKRLQERHSAGVEVAVDCSSSIPPIDAVHARECAVDGLEGTWYEAKKSASDGDWFEVAYKQPVLGKFHVMTGTMSGRSRLTAGEIRVMGRDGNWRRIGGLRAKARDGVTEFESKSPVSRLRVVVTAKSPVPFVLREVKVFAE